MKNEVLTASDISKIEYFLEENQCNTNLAFVFTASFNRNLEGKPCLI
jgi:hypothetical protein